MIYQQFQQSPFQPRISGARAWLAMAISVSLICLSLFYYLLCFYSARLRSDVVLFSRFMSHAK